MTDDGTETADRSSDDLIRSLAKGGSILIAGFVLEVGLSFLAKIVMARVLGRVDYGSVSIGIILAANMSTITLIGLHIGVARYLPRRDDVSFRRGVLVTAYRVVFPLSVLTAGAVFVAAAPISRVVFTDPSLAPLVRVFALAIPFAAVMKLSIGSIRGYQRSYPKALVRNVAQPVVRFLLIIAFLAAGFRTMGVAWAYFGAYVAAAVLAVYFVLKYTPLWDSVAPDQIDRELLSFSAPLGVTSVATLIVAGIGIDTVMIAFFTGTGAVGDYNVIYPVANLIIVVFSALSFLFMPILSELEADGRTDEMGR